MRDIGSNNDEEIIFADDAIFERRADESWIILRNGHIQYRKHGSSEGDTVAFTQITRPTGLAGENFPKRKWTGFFELGFRDFLDQYPKAKADPRQASQWMSEALERFGIPILALAHTMLGLALVNLWGGATGRSSKLAAAVIVCGILFVHFMLVLACEFASSQGVFLAIIVAIAMAAEMLAAVALFFHAMRRCRLSRTRMRGSVALDTGA
jgi:lipopolysaccharide export system permease protein